MRKFITIISAILLVLSLSQCKKKPVVTDNALQPVSITLDVNGGSKVNVTPGTGEVAFENGDVIYVAYDGKYAGAITHNGECFAGNISVSGTPSGDKPLYFYFLGNKTPYKTLTIGSSTSISVDIIDQTDQSKLPVISAAASKEPFIGSGTYTSTLENKCALVKFNVTTNSTAATRIAVGYNKVDVDLTKNLADNSFAYRSINDGTIVLSPNSSTTEAEPKWAILLPQLDDEGGSAYSYDNSYIGTRGALTDIKENYLISSGVDVNIYVNESTIQGIVHNGIFSVSANKRVLFSQGNLQYKASEAKWRLAENQYDYVGGDYYNSDNVHIIRGTVYIGDNKCNNNEISAGYAGWIDMLGWGTTGINGAPYPYITTDNANLFHAYDVRENNLYDANPSTADWGYCAISNGGNQNGYGWRTLTVEEWSYLLCDRPTISGKRYVYATITGTNYTNVIGLIIIPDNWSNTIYPLNDGTTYSSNNIALDVWQNTLESSGCVFLPAGGNRRVDVLSNVGNRGIYWSSSVNDQNYAQSKILVFYNNVINTKSFAGKYMGESVRLVYDANNASN